MIKVSRLDPSDIQKYLESLFGGIIQIDSISTLGGMEEVEYVLKDYGYGTPLLIKFTVDGEPRKNVLGTVRPGAFGHDLMSDRAAILLWQSSAFNHLPRHVRSIDVGGFTDDGLKSIGDVQEVFLLMEYAEGVEYFHDLDRIKDTGVVNELDFSRVKALASYLSSIHSIKKDDPGYYERRTRELIGHNECIFGLTDSYPMDHEWIKPAFLAEIEKRCIDWRWRNKLLTHRLSQVHGDFHPFNILFREGTDFTALDRSRGSYGEPADDLAGLSINYLFWGLLHKVRFTSPFKDLWDTFYSTYLNESGDEEVLRVIPPYLSWRALVVGSPVWYPHYSLKIRRTLLRFARNILEVDSFNPFDVKDILGDSI